MMESVREIQRLYGIKVEVREVKLLRKRGLRGWLQVLDCDRFFWEAHLTVDGLPRVAVSECSLSFQSYDWSFTDGEDCPAGLSLYLDVLARPAARKILADRRAKARRGWMPGKNVLRK